MYDYAVVARELQHRHAKVEFAVENHYEPTLQASLDAAWCDLQVYLRCDDVRYLRQAEVGISSIERLVSRL
jgi:hypothetical protein